MGGITYSLARSPYRGRRREEEEEEEINIINMTVALDNMVRLESRRARTAMQRMRSARSAMETIEVGSSDEDDNNEVEVDTEEAPTPISEETDSTDSDVNDEEEEVELDLTVFGTGIPTFDFTTPSPRRTVRVPRISFRNRRQSPMFVFGANETPPTIASAFEMPTNAESRGPHETQTTTLPLTPPVIEMTRTQIAPSLTDALQEAGFEWTPINLEEPGFDAMTRLFARPEIELVISDTDTEEITDE